jgi:ammonia channel protein AmtB
MSAVILLFRPNRSRTYESDEDRMIANVPHNRTFVALGAGMLWFGWFGFNGGSALSSNGQAVFASINSAVAAATAMNTWIIVEWLHLGKPSLVGACIGLVAGLATVTPTAGFVRPWAAFLLGIVAGPFCYGCVELRKVHTPTHLHMSPPLFPSFLSFAAAPVALRRLYI